MKELQLGYVGMINPQIDNELKILIPSILEDWGVKSQWEFQEATLQSELPYRIIGWSLSRELDEFERIEINYAMQAYNEVVKIIRI